MARATSAELAEARTAPMVWPALCGAVSGWAGVGIARSRNAASFARDGERAVICGAGPDACDVYALGTGAIDDRVSNPWPDGLDGSPVLGQPAVAKIVAALGAPGPVGRWPYADELRVSWRVAADGASSELTLLALATGDERVVARVPRTTSERTPPAILEQVTLSPDGSVLLAETFSGQGGHGYDVVIVNVHAEAAALFATMGASYAAKAAAARTSGTRRAPTFEVGATP